MKEPNYDGGCIVNLSNSIVKALGGETVNEELKALPAEEIDSKNIILLIIDGLGYEFLKERKDSFMWKKCKEKITSVFPTSTPCAMTGIYSGLTPQQHGIPEWYAYLEEVGEVTIPLPFETRKDETPLGQLGLEPEDLYNFETIFERIKVHSYTIQEDFLLDTQTSRCFLRGSDRIGCKDFQDLLEKVGTLLQFDGKKLISAYWSHLDSKIHSHGNGHEDVEEHFRFLDEKLEEFCQAIEGLDAQLIITADHGLVDVKAEDCLIINDKPEIRNCLRMPLTGGTRTAMCYLKDGKEETFRKHLEGLADVYEPQELLDKGMFGRGDVHEKYLERLGDLVVVMKEGKGIKDFIEGEEWKMNVGRHGGLSERELYVPLIII